MIATLSSNSFSRSLLSCSKCCTCFCSKAFSFASAPCWSDVVTSSITVDSRASCVSSSLSFSSAISTPSFCPFFFSTLGQF